MNQADLHALGPVAHVGAGPRIPTLDRALGNARGSRHHLVMVVHDPQGAVFREHHHVHAGQALFHADNDLGNLACDDAVRAIQSRAARKNGKYVG